MTDYLLGVIASLLLALTFRGFEINEKLRKTNSKLDAIAKWHRNGSGGYGKHEKHDANK
ncbi:MULTISPECIES: hypothetical protein [Atopobium]|uniref:hypothetical protein n=1 Tax=Atopobium TaxID=1380 RepID=UPI0003AE563D|nr:MULTISPECIES: hypothetical protein [Atopobium]ERL15317.1 hypothetical protein HMPREF1247_0820 [Atopobium sp. BV3Ac4]